jgi:hypothetical protein
MESDNRVICPRSSTEPQFFGSSPADKLTLLPSITYKRTARLAVGPGFWSDECSLLTTGRPGKIKAALNFAQSGVKEKDLNVRRNDH